MTQPEKKTIEQIAAMSGAERSRYLLSLSHEERQAIDEDELLKAIDIATVQMLTDDMNAETDVNSDGLQLRRDTWDLPNE